MFARFTFAATLLLSSASLVAQPASPPAETLFRNVRVFDGSGAPLSPPTDVLVRGNIIAGIGAAARPVHA